MKWNAVLHVVGAWRRGECARYGRVWSSGNGLGVGQETLAHKYLTDSREVWVPREYICGRWARRVRSRARGEQA